MVALLVLVAGCGSEVSSPPEDFGPSGLTLWARRLGRGSDLEPVGLAAVPSGGVLVAGRYYGEVDFGGGVLPSPNNSYQAYVARYDAEGQHVFSRGFGGDFAEGARDIAVLADGSSLVVGDFSFRVDVGLGELVSMGSDDVFVMKLDPLGNPVWAKRFGGTGYQQATAIAAAPDGGAAIVGMTSGGLESKPGGAEIVTGGGFVLRIDGEGEQVWLKTVLGNSYNPILDVAVRGAGEVVFGGAFYDTLDLEGAKLFANGSQDGYIVVLDAAGNHVFSRTVGGDAYADVVHAIAVKAEGGLVLTGQVQGLVDLGGGTTSGIEYETATYLLELDAKGEYQRSALFGRGDGGDIGHGIAVDAEGAVLLTGEAYGKISFGGPEMVSVGSSDAYVAKLGKAGPPVFQVMWGDDNRQAGYRVVTDDAGRVYVAGSILGRVNFGLGTTEDSGYFETFLVALAP